MKHGRTPPVRTLCESVFFGLTCIVLCCLVAACDDDTHSTEEDAVINVSSDTSDVEEEFDQEMHVDGVDDTDQDIEDVGDSTDSGIADNDEIEVDLDDQDAEVVDVVGDLVDVEEDIPSPCPCNTEEYCDYPDDLCGAGEPGVCILRPNICLSGPAVCHCGAEIVADSCKAAVRGYDISARHICDPDAFFGVEPGTRRFQCGPRLCYYGYYYCSHQPSLEPDTMAAFQCVDLPPTCEQLPGEPDCSCLAEEPCATGCQVIPESDQLLLVCD